MTGFVVFLKEFIALYYWYIELFTRKISNIHAWIPSCPDGITPNSGLTGPKIIYIYIYIYVIIIIIKSRWKNELPSLTLSLSISLSVSICLYHSSFPAVYPDYILYPNRAVLLSSCWSANSSASISRGLWKNSTYALSRISCSSFLDGFRDEM